MSPDDEELTGYEDFPVIPATGICSLCGGEYGGHGHNPEPIRLDRFRRCCDSCNSLLVVPARLGHLSPERVYEMVKELQDATGEDALERQRQIIESFKRNRET